MANANARIRFKGIELLNKKMTERPPDKFTAPTEFHFDIVSESQISAENKLIVIKTITNVREINKPETCFEISTGCGFEIENFDEIVKKQDDKSYIIPPEIDSLLKSVALSTTRGIIYSEVRGSYWLNIVVPVILFTPEQIAEQKKQKVTLKQE